MSEQILINNTPMESRVAVLSDGEVQEIFIERQQQGLVGNIYLGTVVRVLPGMQAAFIDIGRTRTAFLHIDDMQRQDFGETAITPKDMVKAKIQGKIKPVLSLPIEKRLHQGERIFVQVLKDELGNKGARVSTCISLPSRYLVYLPQDDGYVGVSTRITQPNIRQTLKDELSKFTSQPDFVGGLIARTLSEHADVSRFAQEVRYLQRLWQVVQERQRVAKSNLKTRHALIYQEDLLPLRAVRDLVDDETLQIIVDDKAMYDQIVQFANDFAENLLPKLAYHDDKVPLFDKYRIEDELNGALERRVDLPSGGYLMIDQTEAMTTIDVNTGSFVGKRSLEDTVYRTNLEACHAIARQIRLRNLGGIIILDFIDMNDATHKEAVLKHLQTKLQKDHAKTYITAVSELGLVEMTRKRTKESLPQQLCQPCPVCQGRGIVKSNQTVCFEILRQVMHLVRQNTTAKQVQIVANHAIIQTLTENEVGIFAELEQILDVSIAMTHEPNYTQEQYQILLS